MTSSHPPSSLVLYGSETGNAHDAAIQIHDALRRLRFRSRLIELDGLTGLNELLGHDLVVFVISTTGQGLLPANSQKFWKSIRRARLGPRCLEKVQFTSFGLGDQSYSKFNWAHRKLYNRLVQLSARPVFERGEGDEQHPEGINGAFLPWLGRLKQQIPTLFPLKEGVDPVPDTQLLPPEWVLWIVEDDTHLDCSSVSAPSLSIGTPLTATVLQNTRTTPESHWQDVRHIVLQTQGTHQYLPGDVLSIQPRNFKTDVDEFLSLMGLTDQADRVVQLVPGGGENQTGTDTLEPASPPPLALPPGSTLRDVLTHHLDIIQIPRRSFFSLLYHFSTDDYHRERLAEFCNPALIDELYDYTTRPRRSIVEVLQEFTSVKIPLEWLPSVIPTLRPRLFSIASGGILKSPSAGVTNFELLVAVVKYQTVIKRIRQGVCTRFLASWKPGQEYQVYLRSGTMSFSRDDLEIPTIMVGPGTGVAPMRSLIWEKYHSHSFPSPTSPSPLSSSLPPTATDLLFFGCRNKSSDFFFSSEWANISSSSDDRFRVVPAFSRDQRTKEYVQDLIRRHASTVYRLLTGPTPAVVYVCGSAGKMPESIRQALIYVFQTGGRAIEMAGSATGAPTVPEESLPVTREEAEAQLAELEKAGRFREDTW